MAIDHPYSLAVHAGGVLFSCGQCPLGTGGAVTTPGRLEAQVHTIVESFREQFGPVGTAPRDIAKLVVYHAPAKPAALASATAILRTAVGDDTLIVTVGVPHFYYDGMLVEIDVYAAPGVPETREVRNLCAGVRASVRPCGPLVHCIIDVEAAGPEGTRYRWPGASWRERLAPILARYGAQTGGLLGHRLLAAPDAHVTLPMDDPLVPDPGATITADLRPGLALVADLVLVRDAVGPAPEHARYLQDGVVVVTHRCGPFSSLQARAQHRGTSLVEQTRTLVAAARTGLAALGLSFGDVVKQQVHYVGGPSANDLHDNMRERNACYERPGPASTGVPVHGFEDPDALVTLELTCYRADPSPDRPTLGPILGPILGQACNSSEALTPLN